MRGLTLLVIALGVHVPARASERPLLVVVEGAPREAAAIRARIGDLLSRPVLSLIDDGASTATGSVAIAWSSDRRTARLCYRDRTETLFRDVVRPEGSAGTSWIAAEVASLVSDAERMAWLASPEILDPFAEDAAAAHVLPASEVLDPWERHAPRAAIEPASSLGRPRPR